MIINRQTFLPLVSVFLILAILFWSRPVNAETLEIYDSVQNTLVPGQDYRVIGQATAKMGIRVYRYYEILFPKAIYISHIKVDGFDIQKHSVIDAGDTILINTHSDK